MFDPITLAMAKPKVIDLAMCGIADAILGCINSGLVSGNLVQETAVKNTDDFWNSIPKNKNCVFKIALDLNLDMYANYSYINEKSGDINTVQFSFIYALGNGAYRVNVLLSAYMDVGVLMTTVCVILEPVAV